MKAMKFDVTGKPELSAAIQSRLFELGCRWKDTGTQIDTLPGFGRNFIYVKNDIMVWECHGVFPLCTLSDLYDLPEVHTIVIDGNTLELSAESYKAPKDSLA